MFYALIFALYEAGEEAGDYEEGEERGDWEAANDWGAQALPGDAGECDRDDADDGAKRGDENRFEPGFAGINDGVAEINAAFQVETDFVDQDDRVFNHDAEERQNSNQTGKA